MYLRKIKSEMSVYTYFMYVSDTLILRIILYSEYVERGATETQKPRRQHNNIDKKKTAWNKTTSKIEIKKVPVKGEKKK